METLKRKKLILPVFVFGAYVYGALEIMWRGFTHPAMLILGGICLTVIYLSEGALCKKRPVLTRCLLYALMITAAEFVCGLILNIWMGLAVWDYSSLPFNIMGQICPGFFFVWFLLSFVCCFVCRAMNYAFL